MLSNTGGLLEPGRGKSIEQALLVPLFRFHRGIFRFDLGLEFRCHRRRFRRRRRATTADGSQGTEANQE